MNSYTLLSASLSDIELLLLSEHCTYFIYDRKKKSLRHIKGARDDLNLQIRLDSIGALPNAGPRATPSARQQEREGNTFTCQSSIKHNSYQCYHMREICESENYSDFTREMLRAS